MKKTKKLLRTCLILLLVFFSLSSSMTVYATNTKSERKAISSITIGGKKAKWSGDPPFYEVALDSNKAKVKVKLKKGWKLKKITHCSALGKKPHKVKNGGTIKQSTFSDDYTVLVIKAVKKKKTATIEVAVWWE